MTLHDRLTAIARREPDRPALVQEAGTVGYARLIAQADRCAAWLAREGVQTGDRVGLTVRDPHRHLVATLALMRLGCGQAMLPSHDPAALRESVAGRFGIQAVLTEDPAAALPGVGLLAPDFETLLADSDPDGARVELPSADPDALALLLSSSGTTGRPKLVPLSQRQILVQSANGRGDPGRHVFLRPISIEHNNAKRQALYALCLGASSVFVEPGNRPVHEVCHAYGVTMLFCSPVQLRSMMDQLPSGASPALPAETQVYFGGSVAPQDLIDAARQRLSPHLHLVYGTTESARIAVADLSDPERAAGSVGRPLTGVGVEVLDEDGFPLPVGEAGRIRVRTPGMATSYFDDPELSMVAFEGGWYFPGDIGEFTPDGQLIYRGRQDDMMNLNSLKLFPSEIEQAMAEFPGIVDCAAFPLRSPVHGDIPMLAVVADTALDVRALLEFGRERLGLRAPRKIFPVDRLPRNAAGKIVIAELQSLARR